MWYVKETVGITSTRIKSNISRQLLNESGFIATIKQTKCIFSLIGVWAMITNNTTAIERYLSVLIHIMCQSILIFVIIPAIIQLSWLEKNMKIKLAYLCSMGFIITCEVKYLAIIYRREEIKKCIKQIENDWNDVSNMNERAIMINNMNTVKKVTTLYGSCMYCGGILHQILMPFLPGSIFSIFDNSTKRLLSYPVCDLIFDDQITPVYEIMYLIHIIAGVIVCTIAIGSCHLNLLFITHIWSQIQIMILKITNIINTRNENEKNIDERFIEIIDFHNKILKFSSNVKQCLRIICMITLIEALYTMCLCEYYSMMALQHNEIFSATIYFVLVQAFISNFFIFCHLGELSKEQFQKVGEAVYMIDWHRLSDKNARAVVIIIAVIQHSPTITAGDLIELSYSSFLSIIKTSAAYLNILRMIDL